MQVRETDAEQSTCALAISSFSTHSLSKKMSSLQIHSFKQMMLSCLLVKCCPNSMDFIINTCGAPSLSRVPVLTFQLHDICLLSRFVGALTSNLLFCSLQTKHALSFFTRSSAWSQTLLLLLVVWSAICIISQLLGCFLLCLPFVQQLAMWLFSCFCAIQSLCPDHSVTPGHNTCLSFLTAKQNSL